MPFDFECGTRGDDRPCKLSISYCDDNDSFHGDTDIDTLKLGIEKAIRMTGYFSIVTKLGRLGSKCEIFLFNMPPDRAAEIINWNFSAYAWSFKEGAVTKEKTQLTVHFNRKPTIMSNLSPENMDAVRTCDGKQEVIKHLGVRYRTDCTDSSATGAAKCKQALARLSKLRLQKIDDKAIATIINSFIILLLNSQP